MATGRTRSDYSQGVHSPPLCLGRCAVRPVVGDESLLEPMTLVEAMGVDVGQGGHDHEIFDFHTPAKAHSRTSLKETRGR